MNQTEKKNMNEKLEDFTDEELPRRWNYLETLRLTPYVEQKMDEISQECEKRGIVAWNSKGEITERRQI